MHRKSEGEVVRQLDFDCRNLKDLSTNIYTYSVLTFTYLRLYIIRSYLQSMIVCIYSVLPQCLVWFQETLSTEPCPADIPQVLDRSKQCGVLWRATPKRWPCSRSTWKKNSDIFVCHFVILGMFKNCDDFKFMWFALVNVWLFLIIYALADAGKDQADGLKVTQEK